MDVLQRMFDRLLERSRHDVGLQSAMTAAPDEGVQMLGAAAAVSFPLPGIDYDHATATCNIDATAYARLQVLSRLDARSGQSNAVYDLAARAASEVCSVPLAMVALLDDCTQWFPGRVGLDFNSMPLSQGFCQIALKTPDQVTVISDTLQDSRVSHHPLVKQAPFVRFYAGAPVHDASGLMVGTVCVVDMQPRVLTLGQIDALKELAQNVGAALQAVVAQAPA